MKITSVTTFLLVCVSFLLAQGTDIPPGTISGQEWTAAGNPYRVNGDVNVQNLAIRAGVQIQVTGNHLFRITGSLTAEGTATDTILFSGTAAWQGVQFDTADANSYMKYCRISGSTFGVRSTDSDIRLENLRIYAGSGNGIEVRSGSVYLERCLIENNTSHGLLATLGGRVVILNSIFRGNLQNGLKTDSGILDVKNSIVTDNAQGGIFLANAVDSLYFQNCTIVDNVGGPGIVLFGGTIIGSNSIIYSNAIAIGYSVGSVNVNYSDIEDLAGYADPDINNLTNFDEDPDFAETQTYTLNSASPCVDRGDPLSSYNDICFPPSQGGNRNDVGAFGGPGACLWFDALVVTPSLLSFGNVSISDVGTKSVLFRNYRDSAITVNAVTLAGTNPELFSVTSGGFVLAAFDSLRRTITFSPQNAGNFSALLESSSSDGMKQVTLSGRGVAPNISVDPTGLNYGNIRALQSSAANVVLNNLGVGTLRISDFAIDSGFFIVDAPPLPLTVAPFTSDTIAVIFTPDSAGSFSDTLFIISNDPDEGSVAVSLNGTGLAPRIVPESTVLDFGQVFVLRDTTVQLSVGNSGSDTLFVYAAELLDPDSLFDLSSGQFPFSIAPAGAQQILGIDFSPNEIGDFSALLRLYSNDPKRDSLDVLLSGSGIAPRIEVGRDTLKFGEVVVNQIRTDSIEITNTGNADLQFSWADPEDPDNEFSLLDAPNSVLLAPAQSHMIHIAFAPADTGLSNAVLPIYSNDIDRDSLHIPLSGTGIQPILTLAADSLDFGTVVVSRDSVRGFEIINEGSGGLVIDTVYFAAGSGSPFQVVSAFPIVIPALGMPVRLEVSFRPPVRGSFTDTLFVSSNDPDHLLVPVPLRGNGIAPTIQVGIQELAYSTTFVTESNADSLLIKNSGEGDLFISDLILKKGVTSAFRVQDFSGEIVIPGSDSLYIVVYFEPDAGGLLTDSLIIRNSDPSNNRIALYLHGNAVYDITPAQFEMAASFDSLRTGSGFTFEATIRDNESLIQQVLLDIRNAGAQQFQRLNLTRTTGDLWSVTLPQTLINLRGIEYYVQIFHGGTITNFGTFMQPRKNAVHVENYTIPQQTLADQYQMISLPVNTQNQSLADLFGDDLGEYDNTEYRIFDWDPDDSLFVEMTDMTLSLQPGEALWLITRERKNLDLSNALSVVADTVYPVALQPGWNMFGNPFAFDVAWSSIEDTIIQGGTAFYYNGTEWTFPVDRLRPFEGYAVYVNAAGSLSFPQREAAAVTKPQADHAGWYFRIEGRSGKFRDTYNFAGVRDGAMTGHDRFDVPEPPALRSEISVSLGQNRAADYRKPGQEQYQFEFIVSSRRDENTVVIIPEDLPPSFSWAVVSPDTRLKYDPASFRPGKGKQRFLLLVGESEFIEKQLESYSDIPLSFALDQNFPNPFNPDTHIRFQLPQPARVNMAVYNLLGQKIRSLADAATRDAGYHEVVWDGRDTAGRPVTSGIYFLHFYTENFRKTIKMVLQR